MGQFTSLIKEKRSALVKQLVVQMSVDPAVTGKSMIFKTLPKKFAEDIKLTSEEGRLAQLVRASSSSSSRSLVESKPGPASSKPRPRTKSTSSSRICELGVKGLVDADL